MHHVALQLAEDEVQHIVEVHANIGCHAEGFAWIPFPALHVPLAAAGDVSQFHIVLMAGIFAGHLVLQIENRLMVAQLQNVIDALAGFLLDQRQLIQDFRRWYQWFFTNHITTQAHACCNVGMVQVIGCTDRRVIERSCRITLDTMGVLEKALKLGKKLTLR
ncbi:hypothetical protein D9M70_215100 [compost metagenome]